jgi:N-acetylglucosaminyldiphosphoundecaprenol N-acetyl-beta-D-mannosaminyltransferase
MKKILFIALHLGYGGVEQATINEANLLSEHFDVSIVSTYKILDAPVFKLNNSVKVIYLLKDKPNRKELFLHLKHINPIGFIQELIISIKILYMKKTSVINHLKNNHYDIIISTRYYYDVILAKAYKGNALLLAREHRHHNNDQRYIKKLCNVVHDFDYFLPVSKELTDFYANKLNKQKVKVFYLPNFLENIPDNEK